MAGKGKGLDGNKSSLIKYAIFLIKWLRPDVFIWENVKGAFSTNDGADYWAIIQAFTNLDGYRCEQQLLNTSWFLPQNRERIYIVGHLTGRSEPGVFPIREKFIGIYERSIETRNIRTLTAGGHSGGLHSSMTLINEVGRLNSSQDGIILGTDGISQCLSAGHGNVPKIKSGTLRTHKDGKGFRESSGNDCPTLPARAREDGSGQVVIQVVGNLKGDGKGFEIAKDGDSINLSNPNSETRRGRIGNGVAQTLDTQCNQAVVEENLIRRLTEIECERLQGFPDDWTKYGIYTNKHGIEEVKKIPKTQRYKMCGNAVTVDVVEAIALNINLLT